MSHQRSNVHHFSPLSVQVREKNFLISSCLNSEKKTKITFKMSIGFT